MHRIHTSLRVMCRHVSSPPQHTCTLQYIYISLYFYKNMFIFLLVNIYSLQHKSRMHISLGEEQCVCATHDVHDTSDTPLTCLLVTSTINFFLGEKRSCVAHTHQEITHTHTKTLTHTRAFKDVWMHTSLGQERSRVRHVSRTHTLLHQK